MKGLVPARRFFSVLNLNKVVQVPIEAMCSLQSWPKEGVFELLFAKKNGLPIPYLPIKHSAIAFRNPENATFAVYGRQSPFDVSMWARDGFILATRTDNEKKYLTGDFGFTAHPTAVFFTQEEIKKALHEADMLINQKQLCNMAISNCYSYSVTVMLFSTEALLKRPVVDLNAIHRMLTVLEKHPLSNHASIGVLNNKVVVDKLLSVLGHIEDHLEQLTEKTDETRMLTQKTETLLGRAANAPSFESMLDAFQRVI
ncbi:MAG: hypothetical protein P1U61_01020 [Legionellaceae bacterium]|nr:hypothetical protein [Legionellaceae bacterium]